MSSHIVINGWPVWYEKFGTGSKIVLLIPDALGTGRSDFPKLLTGKHAIDLQQFTVIAAEPPGWGRSRPPERKYGANVYNNDCDLLFALMKQLGYESFAVIGHSEGGRVALLMAIKHSMDVLAVVVNGISIVNKEYAIKHINDNKNIDKWDEEYVDSLLDVYQTTDQIQDLWNKYSKFYGYYAQYFPNDFCNNQYKSIKCPIIVMHGDQDPLTDLDQASYVANNVQMGKLHRFPHGKHDFHTRNAQPYKDTVQEFLLTVMTENEEKLNNLNCVDT